MPDEPFLRDKAREAVEQRKLPNRQHDRLRGGPGVGAPCRWRKTRRSSWLSLLGTEARLISTGITSTSGASRPGSGRAVRPFRQAIICVLVEEAERYWEAREDGTAE